MHFVLLYGGDNEDHQLLPRKDDGVVQEGSIGAVCSRIPLMRP